jgi:hypothetical protein
MVRSLFLYQIIRLYVLVGLLCVASTERLNPL